MARIAGVNIPTQKRVEIGLRYIHGIGAANAKEICEPARHRPRRRVSDLTESEVIQIREVIDRDFLVEGDLRREVAMNIKRLMDLGCYRGLASPQEPAGPRPAHPHQRPHAQRPRQSDRRQEESHEITGSRTDGKAGRARAQKRKEECRRRRGPCRRDLQQHHHHHHRHAGQRHVLVVGRHDGLQGFAQIHALCGADGGRRRRQEGVEHGMRTLEVEVSGPGSGRESALRALQAVGLVVTSIRDVTPIPHNGCRPPKRRRV